ncbi:MAG TPA: glycosyltransferase family 2 protein [Thermoanaerobaculia bacterium]
MTAPLFSIVIPTRNRAALLRNALRCATSQTFDDYEVLVSNNDSTDDTESVIAEFAGPRVRSVRTDRSLPMPDHWEFALPHARGQYITYLCDDDAVAPNILERTAKAIRETGASVLVAPWIPYYLPTWFDARRRNALLLLGHYTGAYSRHDSKQSLREIYSSRAAVWTPRMLNSFARRDVIDAASARTGGLFFLSPDFSFAVSILGAVDSWVLMDEPLRLFGVAPEGIGAAMTYDRSSTAAVEFVRDFGKESLLRRVPVLRPLTVNHIAETLLWMKEKMGAELDGIELDRGQYYIEVRQNIDELESHGTDVRIDRQMFEDALARESADVQAQVRTAPGPSKAAPLRARLAPPDSWLRRRLFQLRLARGVLLRGERFGFHDIVEAARFVSTPLALGLD